jgi:hypothetical protein
VSVDAVASADVVALLACGGSVKPLERAVGQRAQPLELGVREPQVVGRRLVKDGERHVAPQQRGGRNREAKARRKVDVAVADVRGELALRVVGRREAGAVERERNDDAARRRQKRAGRAAQRVRRERRVHAQHVDAGVGVEPVVGAPPRHRHEGAVRVERAKGARGAAIGVERHVERARRRQLVVLVGGEVALVHQVAVDVRADHDDLAVGVGVDLERRVVERRAGVVVVDGGVRGRLRRGERGSLDPAKQLHERHAGPHRGKAAPHNTRGRQRHSDGQAAGKRVGQQHERARRGNEHRGAGEAQRIAQRVERGKVGGRERDQRDARDERQRERERHKERRVDRRDETDTIAVGPQRDAGNETAQNGGNLRKFDARAEQRGPRVRKEPLAGNRGAQGRFAVARQRSN